MKNTWNSKTSWSAEWLLSEGIQHLYANTKIHQPYSEYKHSLTLHIQRYVVIATKPMDRLQICPIAHN